MATGVSGLLSGADGTNRSILFIIPFGLLVLVLRGNVGLRGCFHRFGYAAERFRVLFRLLSILLDQDVWVYLITQVTELWSGIEAGLLAQP